MLRKHFLIVGLVFLVLGQPVLAEDPVYFADANLKAAVEAQLGVTDPTPTDMLGLTYLGVYSGNITDLTGLESATNLTAIYMPQGEISDISALSGLINLEFLFMHGHRISDISPLSGLAKLFVLTLMNNQISDISALSELSNLIFLDLRGNPLCGDACTTYIPQIISNNPGIVIEYDPCTTQYDLTVSATEGGSVTTPGEGLFGPYDCGTIEDLVATAQGCYEFVNWTGDVSTVADTSDPTTTITVKGDYTVQANFAPIGPALLISSSAGGSVIVPGEGSHIYGQFTYEVLVAEFDPGYSFAGWSGTAVDAGKVFISNARLITVCVEGAYTLQANFTQTTYTLTLSSGVGGSVATPREGTHSYERVTPVAVVARFNWGYSFAGWTGTAVDAGKVANPNAIMTTVTVDGPYTLHANFTKN